MTTILISGISGFIGSYLANKLRQEGYIVYGIIRPTSKNTARFTNTFDIAGDLLDYDRIDNIVRDIKPDIVVHLAALTPVRLSWLMPTLFELTNFNGTYNLVESCIRHLTKFRFVFACYDKDTRLLTKNGFKHYNELSQGELVYTLNPVTAEMEMQPIDHIFTYDYSGELIHFKGRSFNLFVTPNHKMLIRDTVDRIILEDAEKTEKRSIYKIPNAKQRENPSPSKIKVGDKEYDIKDIFYLLGLYIGDGYSSYQKVYRENKSGLSRKEFIKQARDKVTGRFGKIVTKDSNKISVLCKCPRVFFCIPQKDKARKCLVETLTRCNLKFSEYEKEVYFSSEPFLELFKSCGGDALSKTIPDWIFSYNSLALNALFKGLMDSDGWGNRVLSTSSKNLVNTFTELCIRLGKSVHIVKRLQKETKIKGRSINSLNTAYLIYIHHKERVLGQSYNTAKRIKYNGVVWCVSVKNKNVFVERYGDVTFCGNSTAEVYGGQPEDKILREDDTVNPISPYSKSKVQAENIVKLRIPDALILRSNNTYGRPYSGYFVESMMEQILFNGGNVALYNADHKRDYMYFSDHVNAYMKLIKAGARGIFNVAQGEPISNINMVNLIGEIVDKPLMITFKSPDFPRPEDQKSINQNTDHIQSYGWSPLYSRKEGIKELYNKYGIG